MVVEWAFGESVSVGETGGFGAVRRAGEVGAR